MVGVGKTYFENFSSNTHLKARVFLVSIRLPDSFSLINCSTVIRLLAVFESIKREIEKFDVPHGTFCSFPPAVLFHVEQSAFLKEDKAPLLVLWAFDGVLKLARHPEFVPFSRPLKL